MSLSLGSRFETRSNWARQVYDLDVHHVHVYHVHEWEVAWLRGGEKDGTEEEAFFIAECGTGPERTHGPKKKSESAGRKVLINPAPISIYFYHLQFGK